MRAPGSGSGARAKIDAYTARTGREIHLEVDGGVKVDNIAEIAAADGHPSNMPPPP